MRTLIWPALAVAALLGFWFASCRDARVPSADNHRINPMIRPDDKSDAEWRGQLSDEQYRVLRQAGTERAFTGKYWNNHEHGVYLCAGCGLELFGSDTKFESGTGWPSFHAPADDGNVLAESDRALGMTRTEVRCARCGGHLGHVFDDGPAPTHLRYCINSAALDFKPGE